MKKEQPQPEINELSIEDFIAAGKKIDVEGIPKESLRSIYWVILSNGREYPFKYITREAYKIKTQADTKLSFVSSERNRNIIKNLGVKINPYPGQLNFFSIDELINFSSVAGEKYRKINTDNQKFRVLIQPNVFKLNYWAEQSLVEDFVAQLDNHWQWSGTFKEYLWIRIYRKNDSKKVFFVFGINDSGELYLELNCQVSNHTGGATQALPEEKMNAFKNFLFEETNYRRRILDQTFLQNSNWDELISFSRGYILEYADLYDRLELLTSGKVPYETNIQTGLRLEETPNSTKSYALKDRSFNGVNVDWEEKNRSAQRLGKSGEDLVILNEQDKLRNIKGLEDLAEQVHKVKDGAGYDVLSFDSNGKEIYIEVKTTSRGSNEPFFMTINEREFCKQNPESYFLYRLYNFDKLSRSADHFIITGVELLKWEFTAINFELSIDTKTIQ